MDTDKLLEIVGGKKNPTADEFKKPVTAIETHQVLAKVFFAGRGALRIRI